MKTGNGRRERDDFVLTINRERKRLYISIFHGLRSQCVGMAISVVKPTLIEYIGRLNNTKQGDID
ncbi:hypothetical protein ANN_23915 [Periplaneta americana]|uniref:Uncharacterized protein n=1 Tax=Periplaneta americana TaxID=6978 RepID=A0ABQ8S209_PERAM|nr:hypothetical protein ANN_23915 [Periplaneta americana]